MIEGLKFKVTAAQLRGHLRQAIAWIATEADRIEQVAIERGIKEPEAIARAKRVGAHYRAIQSTFMVWESLICDSDEERLLSLEDLRTVLWPLPRETDADIVELLSKFTGQ